MSAAQGWIGVDLDGTLACWGPGHNEDVRRIGAPIPAMVARVKAWLAEGREVRIVTARVARDFGHPVEAYLAVGCDSEGQFVNQQLALIEAWCARHLGAILPVTAQKDFGMVELWDDRCVQVEPNLGTRRDETLTGYINAVVAARVAVWTALKLGDVPVRLTDTDLAAAVERYCAAANKAHAAVAEA